MENFINTTNIKQIEHKQVENYLLEKLKASGIEVITDKDEFNRILERESLLQRIPSRFKKITPVKEQELKNTVEVRHTSSTIEQGLSDPAAGISTLNRDDKSITNFNKKSSDIQKIHGFNPDEYFKFNQDDTKSFIEKVNEWQTDNSNPRKLLVVGKIPPIMKVLGISDNLIEIEHSTLDKIIREEPLYPNDKQGHLLSIEDIYDIPKQLANPVMVLKSRTRDDSYLFFTERKDNENRTILIPLSVNKNKGRIVINEITSMYGRNNEVNFVHTNINENNLIYCDKERSKQWLDDVFKNEKSLNGELESKKQYLGQRITDIETYNPSILTKERLVNFISANNVLNEKTSIQKFVNLKQNEQVYGFTQNNKIYLNPDIMNSNVIAHEYIHIWDKYVQHTNPELWQKGKQIFRDSSLWNEIKDNKNYQDIAADEDLLLSECHARIVGKMAEKILTKIAEQDGKLTRDTIINWDKEVSKYITEELLINPEFGEENYISESIKVEYLKDFLSMPMKDLMNEKNITMKQLQEKQENSNNEKTLSNFDEELIKFKNNELDTSHVFNLGKPSEILVNCGFPKHQKIELKAKRLLDKSNQQNHPFEIEDVKGLDEALKNPIAVFEYGNREKSQNVIVNLEKDGKNFLVGVFFNQKKENYEISDIRGLFNRDNIDWIRWIEQGKMIYGNKNQIQVLIAQQRTNLAEVNNQDTRTSSDTYYLDSVDSLLSKFDNVNEIYTSNFDFYKEQKSKNEIFKLFRNHYAQTDSIEFDDAKFHSEQFYNALENKNYETLLNYTSFEDNYEIGDIARNILCKKIGIENINNEQELIFQLEKYTNSFEPEISKKSSQMIINEEELNDSIKEKVDEFAIEEKDNLKEEIIEKDKIVMPDFSLITQHGLKTYSNMIIDSYNPNTHSYLLKSEDLTQYLNITEETYNELTSETFKEKSQNFREDEPTYNKLLETQYNDYFNQRNNSAYNFKHNLSVYCRKEANSPCDALQIAKELISRMSLEEKDKTKNLLKKLATNKTINEVIVDIYHEAIKEVPLNEEYIKFKVPQKAIARPFYDTISNKGELISKEHNLKIGDTLKNVNIKSDKLFSKGKENISFDELKIISSSKEGNCITLIDKNKSFIEIPLDTVLASYKKYKVNTQKQEKRNKVSMDISY